MNSFESQLQHADMEYHFIKFKTMQGLPIYFKHEMTVDCGVARSPMEFPITRMPAHVSVFRLASETPTTRVVVVYGVWQRFLL